MASLLIIFLDITNHLYLWLREVAYADMARQALGWVPDDALIEETTLRAHPIQLDFSVAKKNRLSWARRRAGQLPH